MTSRRILFGCYEIPGYGGANTASYQLFRIMQEEGFDVHYMNLIDEQDAPYFCFAFGKDYGNPQSLAHVYNCELEGVLYGPHLELTALIDEIAPDVIVGVDFIAALLMKRACPRTKLIFLTAGCQQVKDAVTGRIVSDLITQEKRIAGPTRLPRRPCREEVEAADIADLIITHSDITLSLFHYFFPYLVGKIYPHPIWFGEWIYREARNHLDLAKPFAQRDIDVLFLASSWTRAEKNYPLVKKLIRRLSQAAVHIVGEIDQHKTLSCAHYHGLVTDRAQLFALIGRAKTIASVSLYDSAPGILFEAAAMGCNIVASKNCGNWMICNKKLLVDPPTDRGFSEALRLSLQNKFDDNMKFFLESDSYRQLVEITEVL